MRNRKKYGDKNCIGQQIVKLRMERKMSQKKLMAQLQVRGIDVGQTSLSHLEGQNRAASDFEVRALADIFQIPMEQLFHSEIE